MDAPQSQTDTLPQVLVVDDETGLRDMLRWHLTEHHVLVETAQNAFEATRLLARHPFDLVITDYTMPQRDGMKLLQEVKGSTPETEVIIMTGFGTVEMAVEAMREGAFDFILKPFDLHHFLERVHAALKKGLTK